VSEPFLSEIRMVGFNFAPRGWAFCDGQILPINQNQSLYSLLGTSFGGDGVTSFALPDLRGRVPMHRGDGVGYGDKAGAFEYASRNLDVLDTFTVDRGLESTLSTAEAASYSGSGPDAVEPAAPCLTVNFCIALQGLFPSRN